MIARVALLASSVLLLPACDIPAAPPAGPAPEPTEAEVEAAETDAADPEVAAGEEVITVDAGPETFIDPAQGFAPEPIDDTAGFDPSPSEPGGNAGNGSED